MKLYIKTGSTKETGNFLKKLCNDRVISFKACERALETIHDKEVYKVAFNKDSFDVNKLLEFFLNSRNYNYMMWIEDDDGEEE